MLPRETEESTKGIEPRETSERVGADEDKSQWPGSKGESRYPILHLVSGAYRVLAWVLGLAMAIVVITSLVSEDVGPLCLPLGSAMIGLVGFFCSLVLLRPFEYSCT